MELVFYAFHSHLIGRFPCLHGSGSFITLLLSEDIQCTEENSEDTVLAKERQTKEQGYGCVGDMSHPLGKFPTWQYIYSRLGGWGSNEPNKSLSRIAARL